MLECFNAVLGFQPFNQKNCLTEFCVRDGNGDALAAVRSTEAACTQLDWVNAESNRRTACTARPKERPNNKNLLNSTTLIQAFKHYNIEAFSHSSIQAFKHSSIITLKH